MTSRDAWRVMGRELWVFGHRLTAGKAVREPGAEPPEGWPRAWPMTVADVVVPPGQMPDADGHNDRVRRWAASIRATLEATVPR